MSEDRSIRWDAACACGYNLRGLTLDHNCPECGRPVRETQAQGMRSEMPRKWAEVQAVLQQRLLEEKLSTRSRGEPQERSPVRPGAVWWVAQACSYALFRVGEDVNARALCAALRDYARVEMKTEDAARVALGRAGIRSSEDVGRVVYVMVAEGMLRRSKDDSVKDFAGLFTLDNLFTADL